MPSILNRSLTTLLILFGTISLANAQSSATQQSTSSPGTSGWTWIQDSPLIFCTSHAPASSCSPGLGNIVPTVAGSVWILQVQTGNCAPSCSPTNVTITSVTGGGGTWTACPNCHVQNPSGFNADAWYNLSGSAGFAGSGMTITLSGSSGSVFSVNFVELLPPPGTTASFDVAGTAAPSNCMTCNGPTLALTGTDAVWMNPGGSGSLSWNASGPSPYFTDYNGGTVGLNIPSGTTTPTKAFKNSSNPEFVAIAFKSSSGNFTPPTNQYSLVNVTAMQSQTCGTGGCTVTLSAATTGSGHLLYLESGDEAGTHITSVSGGGSWVVPSACALSQVVQSQNNSASCAYNLSVASGISSLTVTMSGGAATSFAVYEVSTSVGVFVLDAIGSTLNTPNALCSGYCYPGQPLTLSGNNDVIFQMSWDVGGSLGPNYYSRPQIPANGTVGPFNYFLVNEAAVVVLLDSGPSPPTLTWINAVPNQNTFSTGVAFTSSGGSALPNPPTGLTAIVH